MENISESELNATVFGNTTETYFNSRPDYEKNIVTGQLILVAFGFIMCGFHYCVHKKPRV